MGDDAALGMTRLAIIDIEGGDQPKHSGPWHVVFNGEIYNFAQLRTQLERYGHSFTSGSDSEVVAHAIEHWHHEAFEHMDGMFAIAAFNSQSRELVLARDRFGEKPLYIKRGDGLIAFASEPKALNVLGPMDQLDAGSIVRYLHLGYVPGSRTIWRDVTQLEPGRWISLAGEEKTGPSFAVGTHRVPDALNDPEFTTSGARDNVTALENLLRASVASRLVSDVEVGILLSGGLDSTLIASLAVELKPSIRTFTVSVDDPGRNEAATARSTADRLGTHHTEIHLSGSDALSVVDDLACIYDEPFADSSAIPTVLLARKVSEHVSVALSGEGGDELFSGYGRHAIAAAYPAGTAAWKRLPATVTDDLLWRWWVRPRDPLRKIYRLTCDPVIALDDEFSVTPRRLLQRLGAATAALDPLVDQARLLMREHPHRWAEQVDLERYLPGDLLVKVDRASMASGLEVRAPFLAPAIADWALALHNSERGPAGAKALPRQLLARRLGSEIASLPKQGFSVPLARWLRSSLRPLVDLACEGHLVNSGFLDQRAVKHLARSLDRRFNPAAAPLWAIIMFEMWYDRWQSSKRN